MIEKIHNKKSQDILSIDFILKNLPHRYPFIMIDRITKIINDYELVAIKNITINEPFFQGHFPGKPIMPGVLQLEAIAQASGVLITHKMNCIHKIGYLVSAEKVKFRSPVIPGDQLKIYVKIIKIKNNKIAIIEGICKVNEKIVSSAQLTLIF